MNGTNRRNLTKRSDFHPLAPGSCSRRSFLGRAGAAGLALAAASPAIAGPSPRGEGSPADGEDGSGDAEAKVGGPMPSHFPHQDPALVQRMVGSSHGNIEAVRELLAKDPELAKAQWDWGFGDWESALGAASHTGNREIARLLLDHGARPTIFSAAMLGQLAVVRAFVESAPGIQAIPGPHGIPLLDHARFGGDEAAPVLAYLESVGGAGGAEENALDSRMEELYMGRYRVAGEAGEGGLFDVTVGGEGGRRRLMVSRRGGTARGLVYLGDHTFHPAGAPSVRVRFEGVEAGSAVKARSFRLVQGDLRLEAVRTSEPVPEP